MKSLRRSALWMTALAVLASLLLLPLRAQDKPAPTSPPTSPPTPTPPPAAEPAPSPEPAKGDELPPDERVSADNNLSFPVDI